MDVAFISGDDIRRHRNLLGRLGCSLARDARTIAGNWSPPAGLKEPEMDHRKYVKGIANSLRSFSEALQLASEGFRDRTEIEAEDSVDNFVNRSANAAEHLAKAMLLRHGTQPRKIHNLTHLADDIAAEFPELAEAIRGLNGGTQADHTRHYSDAPPADQEDVRHAVGRLKRTAQLLAAEEPHWRSGQLRTAMHRFKSAAVELRDVKALPLDSTDPALTMAITALRDGRADLVQGAHELWTAWRGPQREAQPEPPAPDDGDDGPSP